MQVCEAFLTAGENALQQLVRGISIGKLKTYQLYEPLKARARLAKLNSESLRKAAPRFWQRLEEHDEDFAKDLAQAILVSQLDMIISVLDFLGIPHQDGFFSKDSNAAGYLTEGWQQRVLDRFQDQFPPAALIFYINHLTADLAKDEQPFAPEGWTAQVVASTPQVHE